MNKLQLASYGIDYAWRFYKQRQFIKSYLKPLVLQKCEALKYDPDKYERWKMFGYYPMLTVCAIAEMYIFLKERPLTELERKRLTLMSSMATLCDDLIDEDGWTEEQLLDLLDNKLAYSSLALKTKLIIAMNEEFKKLEVKPVYWQQLRKAFHGQADSIRQHMPDLTLEETMNIAREKNGSYCLAVGALIDEEWTETEKAFIYQHGIIGQIGNDVYDSYKDIQQGIYTIVRKVDSIAELRNIFLAECEKFRELIKQMDGSNKRKKQLIRKFTCVDAFTLYGINQLQDAENKYGRPLDWVNIPRKDLVIDMEVNANRWKYIKTAVRLSREVEKRFEV